MVVYVLGYNFENVSLLDDTYIQVLESTQYINQFFNLPTFVDIVALDFYIY
uniref:Uncharacterized protein n=1 Tax=Physcomitrium patens TaxID=3218 RepID=A0A2K1ILS2_PHYPA|nr:hypothetical protein PHYPA_026543 [Physcomitrium patens]